MKKIISLALVLLLVFSISASAFAAPVVKKAQAVEKSDADQQIDFIYKNIADLSQDSENGLWQYTVTDLDHNGYLELVAAICKAPEYYTFAKVFEVSPELDSFIECDMSVEEGKPFIDIIRNSADTFHDTASDTWYYLFCEDYTQSTSEHYSVKCSVSLKDGYVTPESYATEHCEIVNGVTAVTYEDMKGNLITPEEFNNAGTAAFKGFEKSGTNFSWISLKDVKSSADLSDCYKVFTGEKEGKNEITVVSAPKNSSNSFLTVTKNPTSETCYAGATIYFVANANKATSYDWTFTAPDGCEFTAQQFRSQFPQSTISGNNSSTLTITNVTEGMNGWGAYCSFAGNGQTARSSTAFITVKGSRGSEYTWTCDVCGTWNKDTALNCSKCGTYRYSDFTWTCNACGAWNKESSTYCTSCGTSRYSDYTWTCNVCGAWNKDSSSVCSSCGTSRYSDYTWTCNICGAWNKDSSYSCSSCGSSRYAQPYAPVGPVINPMSDYTWTCDACGAWNLDSAYVCASCGGAR